jgi:hypothetical protein
MSLHKIQEIYPCVCLTCGVKNDFTHPDGLCQNGHDDWLEYRDILNMSTDVDSAKTIVRAMRIFNLSEEKLKELFVDKKVTQFKKHYNIMGFEIPYHLKSLENFKKLNPYDESNPHYPYCLPSHKSVNVYPISEFWYNNKPYLYIGSISNSEGQEIIHYDVIERKQYKVHYGKNNRPTHFETIIDNNRVIMRDEWPEEYLKTLQQYSFIKKEKARDHGYHKKDLIHLVFMYNEYWGLFRIKKDKFRSIYLLEVEKYETLEC